MPVDTGLTDGLLVKHYHLGWSNQRIADEYGISVQAVSKRLTRLGLYRKPISRQVNEALATRWKIQAAKEGTAHHNAHPARSLKIWLRLQLGDTTLTDKQTHLARSWAQQLKERGEVLCYDESRPEGWYYRPRTPSDGQRVIDWPAYLPFPSESFKRALDLPPDAS